MIKKYSLLVLEKAINQALSLDPRTFAKLTALEGKRLELIIKPLNTSFFIYFHQAHLHLLESSTIQADTTIHSSPLGLIRLSLLPSSKARSLFHEKVHISGDLELGQEVKKIFDELDIDWEGHLAHFTGDVIAYQLGALVKKSLGMKNSLKTSLRHSIKDYLQEERRLLPPAEELKDFFHDIDELTLAVERLEAKINLLTRAEL